MNFRNNGLAKSCRFDYNIAIALSKTGFKREKRRKRLCQCEGKRYYPGSLKIFGQYKIFREVRKET